jgi:hypothetical protein
MMKRMAIGIAHPPGRLAKVIMIRRDREVWGEVETGSEMK